jgi:hypothetical protein
MLPSPASGAFEVKMEVRWVQGVVPGCEIRKQLGSVLFQSFVGNKNFKKFI